MRRTISGRAPRTWSGRDFNVICIDTGSVLDIRDPASKGGSVVHAWTHYVDNINAIWHFELIDPDANIWTIQSTRTELHLEVQNGTTTCPSDIITQVRYEDARRRNQEWFIYLVEGAPIWPCISLQNVGSGTFMSLFEAKDGAVASRDAAAIKTQPWLNGQSTTWKVYQQIDRKK